MDRIREAFFRRTLERDFKTIMERQLAIANERIYSQGGRRRSGRLRDFLTAGEIKIGTNPISVTVNYPIYIRFLDMRRNGNMRIYNRQLWGKIYRETLPELKHGFTEEIKNEIKTQLEDLHYGNNTR